MSAAGVARVAGVRPRPMCVALHGRRAEATSCRSGAARGSHVPPHLRRHVARRSRVARPVLIAPGVPSRVDGGARGPGDNSQPWSALVEPADGAGRTGGRCWSNRRAALVELVGGAADGTAFAGITTSCPHVGQLYRLCRHSRLPTLISA